MGIWREGPPPQAGPMWFWIRTTGQELHIACFVGTEVGLRHGSQVLDHSQDIYFTTSGRVLGGSILGHFSDPVASPLPLGRDRTLFLIRKGASSIDDSVRYWVCCFDSRPWYLAEDWWFEGSLHFTDDSVMATNYDRHAAKKLLRSVEVLEAPLLPESDLEGAAEVMAGLEARRV